MRKPASVRTLQDFGRVQLSRNFFMREFLFSEIATIHAIPNIPDDPDLAIAAGRRLCEELLEPLNATFGRVAIRSAFRSCAVNDLGNRKYKSCARNAATYANHIWDRRDENGCMGAAASIVIPWFLPHYERTRDWRPLAWWIHDHLPYSRMEFYPKLAAFNIGWHERPTRSILGQTPPMRGTLTKPGMANHGGSHAEQYPGFPQLRRPAQAAAYLPARS